MFTRMFVIGVALAIGWGAPLPVKAQSGVTQVSPLTLAEARERALERSPEIRAAREAVVAAVGQARQAGAWSNPTLTFSREQTAHAGETNSQNIISLDQRLEIWGQRGARRRAASLEAQAAKARLEATGAAVSYEVTRVYAAAIAATRFQSRSGLTTSSRARSER